MSDEKDPIMEQIQRDAKQSALALYPNEDSVAHKTYRMGLLHGSIDQDHMAWNRCLDAVLDTVNDKSNCFSWVDGEIKEMLEYLEKLRR